MNLPLFRTTILLTVLFLLGGAASRAQESNDDDPIDLFKGILDEKVRKWEKSNGGTAGPDVAKSGETGRPADAGLDALVSDDEAAESEVHAAINPTDTANIVVSPIRYAEMGFTTPIYYTKDFGVTWRKSGFKAIPRGAPVTIVGGGDPMFTYNTEGRVYFSWINLYANMANDSMTWGLFWAYSDDGGATWKRAARDHIAKAATSGGYPYGVYSLPSLYDKQWMAVDRTGSQYRNTVYTVLADLKVTAGQGVIRVARMKPGREEFEQLVPVSNSSYRTVQFSSIDIDREGGVHVTFFGSKDNNLFALWHSVSTDGGGSFTTPTKISDVHMMRFSPDARRDSIPGVPYSRLYPCPHIVIDRNRSGHIYAVWTADGLSARQGNGLDIFFSRSTDNGDSWSAPIVVNDDPRGAVRHQYYPSIAVNDSGTVAVAWYDRRDDASHRLTHYHTAVSTDGGLTFGGSRRLSSVSTDFSSVGMLNGGFGIGEYNQMLMTGSYAIPVWADGRSNDGDINIYAAFLPLREFYGLGSQGTSGVDHRFTAVTDKVSLHPPIVDPGGEADLRFELAGPSHVRLTIVDMNGRVVASAADETFEAGSHSIRVDLSGFATGRYFVRLQTGFGPAIVPLAVVR